MAFWFVSSSPRTAFWEPSLALTNKRLDGERKLIKCVQERIAKAYTKCIHHKAKCIHNSNEPAKVGPSRLWNWLKLCMLTGFFNLSSLTCLVKLSKRAIGRVRVDPAECSR